MEQITNSTNNVLKTMMVRCMLNPNNKDFYIGSLTIERVKHILNEFNDKEFTDMFWSAFEVAQATLIAQMNRVKHIVHDKPKKSKIWQLQGACPNCGCPNYTQGVACPNCDHIEW